MTNETGGHGSPLFDENKGCGRVPVAIICSYCHKPTYRDNKTASIRCGYCSYTLTFDAPLPYLFFSSYLPDKWDWDKHQ